MDMVIAKLQRDLIWAKTRRQQMAAALTAASSEAVELEMAIEKLGGDASEEACREAETAFQERVNPSAGQESSGRPPSNLGFIAGGR